MGFFKNRRIDNTGSDMAKGDRLRNCERCKYCVINRKSPTSLSCTAHKKHVPANGVCDHFSR